MLQEEEGDGENHHPMKKTRLQTMDRISDLPDPIVHHIMSFLTTLDITKLSILSKRFFLLWSSFPVLDFDESTFARTTQGTLASVTNGFLDHIQNSIRLRRFYTVLSEFRVNANFKEISVDRRFDSAIAFAVENRVKFMDLNLGFAKYAFPVDFASKSINVLRLKGFKLDLCSLIPACPSLTALSLASCSIQRDVKFSSETLREIEFHCCVVKLINIKGPNLQSFSFNGCSKEPKPCQINVLRCENIKNLAIMNVVTGSNWVREHAFGLGKLETLILTGCQDIEHIKVCHEKLEGIQINNCPQLSSIEVMAPSLESFLFKGAERNRACTISFVASKRIRHLSIESAGVNDEWIESHLSMFKYLESLRLKGCNLLKKIKVFHETLKNLDLYSCTRLVEAEVDTPQLVSFEYSGDVIEFDAMVTRSICTATLFMKPWITYNNESFYGWKKLLSFFGHCKALKLSCSSHKELIIPEHLRERFIPPLYDLKYLEIHIKSLEKIDIDLVDSLLWLLPLPKTLRVSSGSPSLQMLIKFAYNEMIEEEEHEDIDAFCCRSKPIKCWRHNLTRVEIQSSNMSSEGEAELRKYFLTKAMMLESIRFKIGLD